MRIFLAGATGALGKRLVPLLLGAGHDVVGTTRSNDRAEALRSAGAQPAVLDALDRDAVMAAVRKAEPEVVVHQLTALTGVLKLRNFDRQAHLTNRLRTEALDHLLAAARAAGARRFVAQSFAGWPFAREGGPVKTEDDPLDPTPPANIRRTLEAIRHVESTATEGLVLRYGGFYGPGTMLGAGGEMVKMIRARRLPIIGDGSGVWSFIHIDDAAGATLVAIEGGAPGLYNIVDDEPAPVAEWLPALAAAIGAKPPRRVPVWLGRLLAGEIPTTMMTASRGASNAKAKREFDWRPKHPTWREGFKTLEG